MMNQHIKWVYDNTQPVMTITSDTIKNGFKTNKIPIY